MPSYKLKSLHNKKDSKLKPLKLPFRFKSFFQPGIYAIVNTQTNKYYIGEANNLADRLSRHILQLNAQKHDCTQLQEDWQFYGEQVFDFVLLEIGTQMWSDRIDRLKIERQYIHKYKENIYNMTGLQKINTNIGTMKLLCNQLVLIVFQLKRIMKYFKL